MYVTDLVPAFHCREMEFQTFPVGNAEGSKTALGNDVKCKSLDNVTIGAKKVLNGPEILNALPKFHFMSDCHLV